MRVRHVVAGDAERLREIRLRSLASDPDAFGSSYEREVKLPPDWWEHWARRGAQRTFVAVDDEDRWVGMALVRPDDRLVGEAVVNAMWVAPEARRQGVGRALLDACAEWAREQRFQAVNLNVRVANSVARATYDAAGFAFVRAVSDEHVLKRSLL